MSRRSHQFEATDLALIAVFAALIAVLALVPAIFTVMGVPFALQMIAVMLAPLVLGGWRGGAANALYVLVGVLGLPVFAQQHSGPAVLLGVTGGYLWGFMIGGFLAGGLSTMVMRARPRRSVLPLWLFLVALVDLVVIYVCGTIGMMVNAKMSLGATCVVNGPLLALDLVKAVIAVAIAVAVLTAFPRLMPAPARSRAVASGNTAGTR